MNLLESESPAAEAAPRWDLLGTLLWSVAILVTFVVVQSLVVGVYMARVHGVIDEANAEAVVQGMQYNGTILALGILASAVICGSLISFAIRLKKGAGFLDYLGSGAVGAADITLWGGLLVLP